MIKDIEYKEIRITLPELRVKVKEEPVSLSLTEIRLLLILLEEPFRIIPSGEIIQRAKMTSLNALQVYLARLRIKLDNKFIYCERSRGYSLENQGPTFETIAAEYKARKEKR
jgi:DNA-binding response OmpR family regulator